jgi:hypothetical protein
LGYKANELIDQSINRFIASEHIHLLEQARQNCSKILFLENKKKRFNLDYFLVAGQHYTTMNVLDMYTRNGDRLSFLCNTHMLIEGRRKAMKLGFLAQLIE